MNIDQWPILHAEFHDAKAARDAVLAKPRAKLDRARAEYTKALICPEAAVYEQARVDITKFRREALAEGIKLLDPRKDG